jgi:hypothetical protein
MQFEVMTFSAKSLFSVEKKEKTTIKKVRVSVEFPFDLGFRIIAAKSPAFQGPGIYWVTYKGELIYIGSYSSTQPNLVHDRWVKHIQTFTNRGYRLGFNAQTKKELIPKVLKEYYDRDYFRYCDTGTVTSLERLGFASSYFDDFTLSDTHQIIDDFKFYYCKLSNHQDVGGIEGSLIQKFRPVCNSSSPEVLDSESSAFKEIVHLLKDSLHGH